MSAVWLFLLSVFAVGSGVYVAVEVIDSDDPIVSTEIREVIEDVRDAAGEVDARISERVGQAAGDVGGFFESFPDRLGLGEDPGDADPLAPAEPAPADAPPADPAVTGPAGPGIDAGDGGSGKDPEGGRVDVCNVNPGKGTSVTVAGPGADSLVDQGNKLGDCTE